MPFPRSLLLALLLAPGCTWVTQDQFDARLQEVDDDGDGVAKAGDCDDGDATISPALPETWYDGIDQNCDGMDDYDQDGDNHVPVAYAGLATAGVPGSGLLPDGDCDDTDPLSSPIQPDEWYDGWDRNCDGLDDYDQDQDGFAIDDPAIGYGATDNVEGSGGLPATDCDDADAAVRPGAQDAWYDGVDTDCAGNDDYDQDGDGYYDGTHPDYDYGATEYVDGSGRLPSGDCDDTNAQMHPANTEVFYDGVDGDCNDDSADDDFDADGDGFRFDQYDGDDCDDADAAVFPGATETLGDGFDADCDGALDSFTLEEISGYTWSSPFEPAFATDGTHVYLSIAALQLQTSTVTYYDSAVAFKWLASDVAAGAAGIVTWNVATSDPTTYSLTGTHDFAVEGGYIYGALGIQRGTSRSLWLAQYDISAGRRIGLTAQGTGTWDAYEDVGLVVDDAGTAHAIGCEPGTGVLHYVQVGAGFSFASVNEEVTSVHAAACGLDLPGGAAGYVLTSEESGIVEYTFDPTVAAPAFTGAVWSSTWFPTDLDVPAGGASRTIHTTDAGTGGVVLLDAAGATEVNAGVGASRVSVADDGATLWIGWVDDAGAAWLTWGTAATSWTTTPLTVGFQATDVAVYADGGHVLYAVTGYSVDETSGATVDRVAVDFAAY